MNSDQFSSGHDDVGRAVHERQVLDPHAVLEVRRDPGRVDHLGDPLMDLRQMAHQLSVDLDLMEVLFVVRIPFPVDLADHLERQQILLQARLEYPVRGRPFERVDRRRSLLQPPANKCAEGGQASARVKEDGPTRLWAPSITSPTNGA